MNELIRGAYDLHIHTGPDILQRKVDDLENSRRFTEAGIKGYVIKSHYFCTAERAKLANKVYPDCRAMGAVVLNHAVGGINPTAVEFAGRAGAKIVWFPTSDSANEQEYLATHTYKAVPYWAMVQQQMKDEGIGFEPISILDGDGKLVKSVYDVLDIIAKYNMILATSHISKRETFALVKAAQERKVDRVIVTHVTFPSTFYEVDEQRELLRYGALMEHCYTTIATKKVERSVMIGQIKAIGPEHIVLSTDLGQSANDYPDVGLSNFADLMLEEGFSEQDVRRMIVDNPAALIE